MISRPTQLVFLVPLRVSRQSLPVRNVNVAIAGMLHLNPCTSFTAECTTQESLFHLIPCTSLTAECYPKLLFELARLLGWISTECYFFSFSFFFSFLSNVFSYVSLQSISSCIYCTPLHCRDCLLYTSPSPRD